MFGQKSMTTNFDVSDFLGWHFGNFLSVIYFMETKALSVANFTLTLLIIIMYGTIIINTQIKC